MKAPPSPPRLTPAPSFEDPGVKTHLDKLNNDIRRELLARPPQTQPVDSFLMMSPNGTVFKITVSDVGLLATEELPS